MKVKLRRLKDNEELSFEEILERLIVGDPLDMFNSNDTYRKKYHYYAHYLRQFFGTDILPVHDITRTISEKEPVYGYKQTWVTGNGVRN